MKEIYAEYSKITNKSTAIYEAFTVVAVIGELFHLIPSAALWGRYYYTTSLVPGTLTPPRKEKVVPEQVSS